MDFFKRHYEKITLVGLFILFIFLMWLITSLDENIREVSESDLRLARESKDYVSAPEVARAGTEARELWTNSKPLDWQLSDKQGAGFDLIQAGQYALCPECEAANSDSNKKLIPISSFGANCPNCKQPLKLPVLAKVRRGKPTPDDLDGDGISNVDEERHGLNKNFYEDARYDKDGDGFSNVYEIQQKTDPSDAGSHPPIWHRLVLADVSTVSLGLTLKTVNHQNRYHEGKYTDEDKKHWSISYNYLDKFQKERSRFSRFGGTISIEGVSYRIVDISLPRDPSLLNNKEKGREHTYVVLREVLRSGVKRQPDQLKMILDEVLKSSDQRPVLRDTGFPESDKANAFRSMKIGSTIMVPAAVSNQRGQRRGRSRYRYQLKSVERGYIVLIDLNARKDKDGKLPEIKITRDGVIPKDMWVEAATGQPNAQGNGME